MVLNGKYNWIITGNKCIVINCLNDILTKIVTGKRKDKDTLKGTLVHNVLPCVITMSSKSLRGQQSNSTHLVKQTM